MMTKFTFWSSNFLFDSAMSKHSNPIVLMNGTKRKMTEEVPCPRKGLGNLESYLGVLQEKGVQQYH